MSSFHHWWGGWSFGNRLFTDAFPALLVVSVLVAEVARRELAPRGLRAAILAFSVLSAFSVFVHTHQGLNNPYSMLWCEGIDRDEGRVFDWRRPQFLASASSLELPEREHQLLAMAPYTFGSPMLPTSENLIFEGWAIPEGDGAWRWSTHPSPRILLRVEQPLPRGDELALQIEMGTYGPQVVTVRLNGEPIGTLHSERSWEPETYQLGVPRALLERARRPLPGSRVLELELAVPGAVYVGDGPRRRQLGICLRRLTLGG